MQSKNQKPTVTAYFVKNRTETDRLDKSETVTALLQNTSKYNAFDKTVDFSIAVTNNVTTWHCQ
jgi:hypothetical protein